jgi:short subunit dehydrogenase-like uncharacterized protein
MHRQGMIRRNGKLEQVPPAWNVREQDFGRGPVKTVSIGWGDVSTAYYSTGIPNIETYFAFPNSYINVLRSMRILGPLLYNRPVKNFLKFLINTFTEPGPKQEKRKMGSAIMIGEVTDAMGNRSVSKLITPEGYTCTMLTAVEIMKRILNSDPSTGSGQGVKPGFCTPSLAYGPDFILQFEGVKREDIL